VERQPMNKKKTGSSAERTIPFLKKQKSVLTDS
jgi:hypothetical protein